jgi:hypothetical protein
MQQVVADEVYQGCYANPPLLLAATQTKSPHRYEAKYDDLCYEKCDLAIAKLLHLWVSEGS